ncbi:PmoA family protein [Lederbergia sp. NSJ-179]|uniref:DUF6807 domain-containing protein n=1 Tax=Lederbergia sp. NSJ-179 TaxID=2931402 RepID=UPI001FD2D71A|nr:PmoA family protein [Lederbergia sp. NSJ-179]MCJ7839412.1 PmoA family protein [Lederbergia sp. NSJ-179]
MSRQIKLKVTAGSHDRKYCPILFQLTKALPRLTETMLADVQMYDENGTSVPVQCTKEADSYVIHWIVQELSAHETMTYTIDFAGNSKLDVENIELREKENQIDIMIEDQLATSYVMDPTLAKPYLGPIIGPNGLSYTRLDFETTEHPHHRSIWLGIGDVNGVDAWNERPGFGKQKIDHIGEKHAGPVFARISSEAKWTNFKGSPLMRDQRTFTVYNTPAHARIMDVSFTLHADYGRVELGATKEAGPLGIRVAETMSVDNGGRIVNAYGSVGEEECWGKSAPWCDYYGEVEGDTLGIATFEDPQTTEFPTYWHIRNYGLIAPNNLYFRGGQLLRKGESLTYHYRIYFHAGSTEEALVAERYQDFIHPPKVEMIIDES